jgi:mono/diheme cytochrome c family protein
MERKRNGRGKGWAVLWGVLMPWSMVFDTVACGGYASPVETAVSTDSRWLLASNLTDASVSLVDLVTGEAVDRIHVGAEPRCVAAVADGRFLCVTCREGDLIELRLEAGRLAVGRRLALGLEPRGLTIQPDGRIAWISRSLAADVVAVDLASFAIVSQVAVGGWPRGLAFSPRGDALAVSCSGPAEMVIIDPASRTVRERHRLQGMNVGQPAFTADGGEVVFPWTYDSGSHPSPGNIRRGWVVGSRLGSLRLPSLEQATGTATLAGLTLDVAGQAVGDPAAVSIDPQSDALLITAGGTHELLWLSRSGLPFGKISGTDTMPGPLANDRRRFRRLQLGGRPQGLQLLPEARRAYVANQLLEMVQEIDLDRLQVIREISLASRAAPTPQETVVRRGEAAFYDAGRSLDQWYSCHTCHFEGGGNSVTIDTLNDGSQGTYKTVLPLYDVVHTGPWTWHGWQDDLSAAIVKSFTDTMQGPSPPPEDVAAVLAYLGTLAAPAGVREKADRAGVARGRELFSSDRAGCMQCHQGPYLQSSQNHDVGLGSTGDAYSGFQPPSLLGVGRKTIWLHDGRARSLEQLLVKHHGPDRVSGLPPFTPDEVADLVAYLRSL